MLATHGLPRKLWSEARRKSRGGPSCPVDDLLELTNVDDLKRIRVCDDIRNHAELACTCGKNMPDVDPELEQEIREEQRDHVQDHDVPDRLAVAHRIAQRSKFCISKFSTAKFSISKFSISKSHQQACEGCAEILGVIAGQ